MLLNCKYSVISGFIKWHKNNITITKEIFNHTFNMEYWMECVRREKERAFYCFIFAGVNINIVLRETLWSELLQPVNCYRLLQFADTVLSGPLAYLQWLQWLGWSLPLGPPFPAWSPKHLPAWTVGKQRIWSISHFSLSGLLGQQHQSSWLEEIGQTN